MKYHVIESIVYHKMTFDTFNVDLCRVSYDSLPAPLRCSPNGSMPINTTVAKLVECVFRGFKPWSRSDINLKLCSDCPIAKRSAFSNGRHLVLSKIFYNQCPCHDTQDTLIKEPSLNISLRTPQS